MRKSDYSVPSILRADISSAGAEPGAKAPAAAAVPRESIPPADRADVAPSNSFLMHILIRAIGRHLVDQKHLQTAGDEAFLLTRVDENANREGCYTPDEGKTYYQITHIFRGAGGVVTCSGLEPGSGVDSQVRLVFDAHFAKLREIFAGDFAALNVNLVITGNKLFNGASFQALGEEPLVELHEHRDPVQILDRHLVENDLEIKYQENLQKAGLAKLHLDAEVQVAGLGQMVSGLPNAHDCYRGARAAYRIGYTRGVIENINRLFLNLITFASSVCTFGINSMKVGHALIPVIIPAALAATALVATIVTVATILGIVGAAMEGIDQAQKLYRQVRFYNDSPHMQLARFLQQNKPKPDDELCPERNEKFLRELNIKLELLLRDGADENLVHGLERLTEICKIPHTLDMYEGLLRELDIKINAGNVDKKMLARREQYKEQIFELGNKLEQQTASLEMHEMLYREATTLLARTFNKKYFNKKDVRPTIELQKRVGETIGNTVVGKLDGLAFNSSNDIESADEILKTFKTLDEQAHKKAIIHGVGIAIAIVTIVSLGLTFASGVGLIVPVALFAGIVVLSVVHYLYTKSFQEKSLGALHPSKPIEDLALLDGHETDDDDKEGHSNAVDHDMPLPPASPEPHGHHEGHGAVHGASHVVAELFAENLLDRAAEHFAHLAHQVGNAAHLAAEHGAKVAVHVAGHAV